MQHVTYSDMAARHGKPAALDLLRTIERLAQIRDEIFFLDPDVRFEHAFKALCEIDFAARAL